MEAKFDNLIPLIINCLLDKPLKNCPFLELRKEPILKRIEKINVKDISEKEQMYNHHFDCYLKRVRKEHE